MQLTICQQLPIHMNLYEKCTGIWPNMDKHTNRWKTVVDNQQHAHGKWELVMKPVSMVIRRRKQQCIPRCDVTDYLCPAHGEIIIVHCLKQNDLF